MKKLKKNVGLRNYGSKARTPGEYPRCGNCGESHSVTITCDPAKARK